MHSFGTAFRKIFPEIRPAKIIINARYVQMGDFCELIVLNEESCDTHQETFEANPSTSDTYTTVYSRTQDIATKAADERPSVANKVGVQEETPAAIPGIPSRWCAFSRGPERATVGEGQNGPFVHKYLRYCIK